jgi:hypothetical protein
VGKRIPEVLKRLLAKYLTTQVSLGALIFFPFTENLGIDWLTFDHLKGSTLTEHTEDQNSTVQAAM